MFNPLLENSLPGVIVNGVPVLSLLYMDDCVIFLSDPERHVDFPAISLCKTGHTVDRFVVKLEYPVKADEGKDNRVDQDVEKKDFLGFPQGSIYAF